MRPLIGNSKFIFTIPEPRPAYAAPVMAIKYQYICYARAYIVLLHRMLFALRTAALTAFGPKGICLYSDKVKVK